MEDKLSEVSGVNLGFLEYLLSIQYENKGDHKKSEYYLEKSKKTYKSMIITFIVSIRKESRYFLFSLAQSKSGIQ